MPDFKPLQTPPLTDREKFYGLLKQFPNNITVYWDTESHQLDQQIHSLLKQATAKEQAIINTLLTIWDNNGRKHLIDMSNVAILDGNQRIAIANWIINPFWP